MTAADESSKLPAFDDGEFGQLLSAAKSGSSSELGRLLESFRPALIRLAEEQLNPRIRRRMSGSDLVQETMLTAGKQFESFRGAGLAEFQTWLYELFHSRLVDGLRRHQIAEMRRMDLEEEHASLSEIASRELSPSVMALLEEDASRLLAALSELPEEAQRLIHLRYLEDRTFEEIASVMDVSVATVWRRFQDATELLHRRLMT